MISKDHKLFFSQNKILKIGLELIAQVRDIKVFGKENTKKILRKNFLINMKLKNKIEFPKLVFL